MKKLVIAIALAAVSTGAFARGWHGGPHHGGSTACRRLITVGYKRNATDDGWVSITDGTSLSFSHTDCPTRNSELQTLGYIDSTGNLVAAHDAATAHLGAPWRMPTEAEFSALVNNCDAEWTTTNGVAGRLVKGRGAYSSKSIFLPATGNGYDTNLTAPHVGHYWSSTPFRDDEWHQEHGYSYGLYFFSGEFYLNWSLDRGDGNVVRPVRGFEK